MIGITSIFTSQSPAWIAATFQGMFSQRTDPVRMMTGNPIHNKKPKWTAAIQLLIPRSATRRAITQARTRHRTSSMSSFPAGKLLIELVRSEEHTSELQSRLHLVCRLLLEKKKKQTQSQQLASKIMIQEEESCKKDEIGLH